MRRSPIACALLVGWCSTAFSRESDPYAKEYRKSQIDRYKEVRAGFLDTVRTTYFAIGCKVLPSEGYALRFLENEAQAVNEEGMTDRVIDKEGLSLRRNAAMEGLARAKQPGTCDYWHEHPKAVAAMRRAAEAAMQ